MQAGQGFCHSAGRLRVGITTGLVAACQPPLPPPPLQPPLPHVSSAEPMWLAPGPAESPDLQAHAALPATGGRPSNTSAQSPWCSSAQQADDRGEWQAAGPVVELGAPQEAMGSADNGLLGCWTSVGLALGSAGDLRLLATENAVSGACAVRKALGESCHPLACRRKARHAPYMCPHRRLQAYSPVYFRSPHPLASGSGVSMSFGWQVCVAFAACAVWQCWRGCQAGNSMCWWRVPQRACRRRRRSSRV